MEVSVQHFSPTSKFYDVQQRDRFGDAKVTVRTKLINRIFRRQKMRIELVILGSLVLSTSVVGNAYFNKKQFYPSVVHITKSNPSMMVGLFFQLYSLHVSCIMKSVVSKTLVHFVPGYVYSSPSHGHSSRETYEKSFLWSAESC